MNEKIINWGQNWDYHAMMEEVKELWIEPDETFKRIGNWYYLDTCGHYDNEELITSLEYNTMFWLLCWQESRRGGHYVFEIPEAK